VAKIQALTAEIEPGTIYVGKVIRIVEFGAFVNILPGTDGLLHISQISNERIANVADVLKEGQEIKVQVADVDNRGRIKLTMKDIEQV
ncbi:MAG: S1 RNA-binding domain-containing protein, partial [Acinetobacter sp.]